jgi:hypothetical protein
MTASPFGDSQQGVRFLELIPLGKRTKKAKRIYLKYLAVPEAMLAARCSELSE